MLSGEEKIPFAVLFGGDHYMLFSLCPMPKTALHGLICSSVFSILDNDIHFMSLLVFCLLGSGAVVLPVEHIDIPTIKVMEPLGRTRQATHDAIKAMQEKSATTSTPSSSTTVRGWQIPSRKVSLIKLSHT
jgi:hypothetical protein